MSEISIQDTHIIHLKGKGKKFAVSSLPGRKSRLDVDLGMLHAIGYWVEDKNDPEFEEVWIPFTEINHVEGLVYRHRS